MACVFSNVENSCGCLIGYNLPLLTVEETDITNYPVTVINVNGVELAEANSPSEYAAIWNTDADNQAVGVLSAGTGAFCFFLSRKSGVTPPANVLGSFTPPPPPELDAPVYGFTELDTTGETPGLEDYIASVAGTETLPEQEEGPVVVEDFGNATDKVCFMGVPAGWPAFTLWSEEGNPLQQNQPIDPDWATGSNVWFLAENQGDAETLKDIYFTRAQTSFGGAITFHN